MATNPPVNNVDRVLDATATAGQTAFPITWPVIADSEVAAASDIVVEISGITQPISAYSFTGTTITGLTGIWNGGTVTLNVACAGGERVIIYSNRAPRRTGSFLEGKSLPFTTLDQLMDDFAIMLRDQQLGAKRAVKISMADYENGVDPNGMASQIIADSAAAVAAAQVAGSDLWSRPVMAIDTTPPGSPAQGDRYLVAHSGTTGAFVGFEDQVAQWSGSAWLFSGAPKSGQQVYDENTEFRYRFTGTIFKKMASKYVYTSDFDTVTAALTMALASSLVLIHDDAPNTWTLTGDVDMTSYAGLKIKGGIVKPNGHTLTVPANFYAPPAPWIDLSAAGHVQTQHANCPGYPEWYVGCVADCVGTLGASSFTVTSGTDNTALIQELWTYGPYELRYSAKGAYYIATTLIRNGDHPHHHVFPHTTGQFGTVGFVGAGAAAQYLSAITNASAIEKGTGIKYIVQSGLIGSDGLLNDIWTRPMIVATDFTKVICFGQLYGGETTVTVNYVNLEYPMFRGYIGLQVGYADKVVLTRPHFDGYWAALALEVPQVGAHAVINKVDIYSPDFSQTQNASGQIIWSKNYANAAPSQELKCVNIRGGDLEFGFYGVKNDCWQLVLDNVWMERIAVGSQQILDTGRMIVMGGHYSGGDITPYLNGGSMYFDGAVLNGGPSQMEIAANTGTFCVDKNGWIGANFTGAKTYHRITTLNNATEGDALCDIGSKNLNDTIFYAVAGAGGNAGATGFNIQKNSSTSRSINAGGTVNASGADYAEYRELTSALYGQIAKGDVVGLNADGMLTNVFVDIVGRVLIKSTDPSYVGNDAWGTEDAICQKYGCAPVNALRWSDPQNISAAQNVPIPGQRPDRPSSTGDGDTDAAALEVFQEALSAWAKQNANWAAAVEAETTAFLARKAAFSTAYETERTHWDRVALCGLVPCNVTATMADIGKYLVPAAATDGTVTATLVAKADLTLAQYMDSFGAIEKIGADGRPLVNVKVT